MLKVHGRRGFGEEDKELVRLDVELSNNISIVLGILAKLIRERICFFHAAN